MSSPANEPLWDSREVSISFTRHQAHVAVELTLRRDPTVQLVLYELGDGLHVARKEGGRWSTSCRNTVVPPRHHPTDKNLGFVEACVSDSLRHPPAPGLTFEQCRQKGATLARRGKLSPETLEVFDLHVASHKGLLKQTERRRKVDAMKRIVKELGDMDEEEMLSVWREARAEEVMES